MSSLMEQRKSINGMSSLQDTKGNIPLMISSVNVTKSEVSCGFGHIY